MYSRFRGGLLALVIISLGCVLPQNGRCSSRAQKCLGIERQDSITIPMKDDKLITVGGDGGAIAVPVVLREISYQAKVQTVGESEVRRVPLGRYELRWEVQHKKVTWSMWSDYPLGEFRLLQDERSATNYLVWVYKNSVCFTPIVSPRDQTTALTRDFLERKHGPAGTVTVPVLSLLGAKPFEHTGIVNAQIMPIKVVSINRKPDGSWVLEIRGTKSDRTYTLISDKEAKLGWCLAD